MRFYSLLFVILAFTTCVHAENPICASLLPKRGLPGEGDLRRYEGYVNRWPVFREAWSKEVKEKQGSVVFLGDSITQGWGKDFKGRFPGMKLANRGIGGDTTRGMLIRLEEDVLALNPFCYRVAIGDK